MATELHPLGRRLNHDPRSLRYLVNTPARAIASVEHQRMIPVLDQGDLGSCTGNAAVGALGTQPLYGALNAAQQSTLDEALAIRVYSAATRIDPFPGWYDPNTGSEDTGSDGLSAAKACRNMGLDSGELHATSLTAMQGALMDTPVIIGIDWTEGFDTPDREGIVRLAGNTRGGHEVEVLGQNVERGLFHAVNSWGDGWGHGGHFWLPFEDMDTLLHRDGDCTQLLPLTVPAPTPTPAPPPFSWLKTWWHAFTAWLLGRN